MKAAQVFCLRVGTLLPLVLIALFSGCDSSPKAQIERVLKKDKEANDTLKLFAPEKGFGNEDLNTFATMIRGTVQDCKSISQTGCPADFTAAYIAHVRAWEDFADVIQNHPHVPSGAEAFLGGLVRGMMGDPTGGLTDLKGQFREWAGQAQRAEGQIKATWRGVEDVAIRHGAKLP